MPTPLLLTCADPLEPRTVEPAFRAEAEAARAAGFALALLDHDELDRRVDPGAALRRARLDGGGPAVYRGWMLRGDAYARLFEALAERGVDLLTTPAAYAACHHAPGSYPALAPWMPRTAWLPLARIDDAAALRAVLDPFGAAPVILKDWVKSQASGYWDEACFIPDASDAAHVARVIGRFRALQGESLEGGLVFKAYVPLRPVGGPAHEHRAFVVRGAVVGCWPRGEGPSPSPPPDLLAAIAAAVPSPFASADLAQDRDGRWWLLEVGDGGVSGLPDPDAAVPLFAALAAALAERGVSR